MKILLTGATGMVGRNIVEHPALGRHTMLAPTSSELDLRDYSAVLAYLRSHRPDLVIHAAGKVGGIQANMREPVRFLLDNLDMGRNIVWASRQCGVRRLINLGSSCMYPRNAQNPLREEMVLQGELEPTNEGYAIAKIATARLCEYISREDPVYQYKTLIPCNIYGRWDKFDVEQGHMIPAVLRKIHDAYKAGAAIVEMWGDGTARREFMYAGDLADCIVRAIDRFDTLPTLMNVGLGYDHSINEYYQAIAAAVGYRGSFSHDLSRPVGMKQKLVSVELLAAWGWKAKTALADGLVRTYEFYLQRQGAA